ncbi:MAG: hypothetical protein COX90_01935 [Candidatus Nealsonbacteria bacterium CG_4_10_14_0_2_um_filter_38_17]|uniref:Carbohydrate kinase PfkB domain-containing protein n=2 Tax=Candidatus Nealsoniibacteriota TaxID=1817911 RepID=A0A2M7UYC4_9BACT|nr:MAG: hypothetical protein COX36_03615 [Candidatus Nealsonbacteria bacterium CG23_combo_of_CG06-09_8_20_14_all_38_19]PIZ88981.1 MAG: hypothetical protein COX90_01935 [Candidatus Nealsonbacteria bacterium CG_4_10_14_0_2_um_filter_38_17]
MNRIKKFLVIGPVLLDLTIKLKNRKDFNRKMLTVSIGGKGYNVAHTLSLFGAPVSLATIYGFDDIGNYLIRQIKKQGIKLLTTSKLAARSGVCMSFIGKKGDIILDKVDTEIFKEEKVPKIDWGKVDIIIVISTTSAKTLTYLKRMKKRFPNKIFCLEIAGRKTIANVLPYLKTFDFFISNLKEAIHFGFGLKTKPSIKNVVESLLKNGPKIVLVTAGSKGIYYGHRDIKNQFIIKHIKAKKIKNIVSTLGAGDSVTASFCAAYYGRSLSLEKSVEIANEVAAITVTKEKPFPSFLPKYILNFFK